MIAVGRRLCPALTTVMTLAQVPLSGRVGSLPVDAGWASAGCDVGVFRLLAAAVAWCSSAKRHRPIFVSRSLGESPSVGFHAVSSFSAASALAAPCPLVR